MGCVTMGKGKDITHYAPLAVVSVVSNYDINWFGEAPLVRNAAGDFIRNTLWRRNDQEKVDVSKADVLINDADSILRTILTGAGMGEVAEKDLVIQARSYTGAKINAFQEKSGLITADGYRMVDYRDKSFPANMVSETGIQGYMFVTFNFTKSMTSGIGKNGTFRPQLEMAVTILNGEGKQIYSKTFNAHSYERISVSGGTYYHEELMDLFQDVLVNACDQLITDLRPAGPGL
jgi:hypothetical protein